MSKVQTFFTNVGSKAAEISENVNWKAVGTVLTVVGAGIALVAGFAKDQNNDKVIRETARKTAIEELQKLLNDSTNNHHNDG